MLISYIDLADSVANNLYTKKDMIFRHATGSREKIFDDEKDVAFKGDFFANLYIQN